MSVSAPPEGSLADDELVVQTMPWAIELARTIARIRGVRSPAVLKDCEQTACLTLLEKRPKYDSTRGPFKVFAWKAVAGAVTRMLRRERAAGRTGLDDALDEAEGYRDTTDAFAAEDSDDMGMLKAACRFITFRRVMGDTHVALRARPDQEVLRAQVLQAARDAVGGLDERHVRLIELRYWEELTWEEIGERMGFSDRHAKRIHKEIRDRLEGDLRLRGVEEPPPSVSP